LDRRRDKYLVETQLFGKKAVPRESFDVWYSSPLRKRWLLGCWSDPNFVVAKSTKKLLQEKEGLQRGYLYLTAQKGRVAPGQWLLHF